MVIDKLKYDKFKVFEPIINNYYKKESESAFFSILPTATQYARNAIFSGLMPSEMEKLFPQYWKNDTDEGGKNMFEKEFLDDQINRLGLKINCHYTKIASLNSGKKFVDNFKNITTSNHFTAVVYNFVDMLSHARTEMEVIRELADDESAYRSLTLSWFDHSALHDIVKKIAESGRKLVITTDHGTVRVDSPVKIMGERSTNTNLR